MPAMGLSLPSCEMTYPTPLVCMSARLGRSTAHMHLSIMLGQMGGFCRQHFQDAHMGPLEKVHA